MPRKIRSDSSKTERAMAQAKIPDPPEHVQMPDEALPVWRSIVCARDLTAWTQIDLEHAANLACCLSDLERIRREVREEGDTLQNARGTPVVNPKHQLIETLSRRSVALSRLLHVHAEATSGESRDQGNRSKKQRELNDAREGDSDDDLIQRPTH